jgi:UDP-N-acetylmuramate dehydrogenase
MARKQGIHRYNSASMNTFPLLQRNVGLKAFNSFGIDANAGTLICIESLEQLDHFYTFLKKEPDHSLFPGLILGGGSNLILSDELPFLVLQMSIKGKRIIAENASDVIVEAAAGENWHEFVLWTLQQGFGGLENLSLIPGTVGAAPIQNIGAYGVEMQDCFFDLTAFDLDTGETRIVTKSECRFAYRDSVFKHELKDRVIIVSVRFALPKIWFPKLDYGDVAKLLQERDIPQATPSAVSEAIIHIRQSKLPDPKVLGNAGSFFKNPLVDAATRDRLLLGFPAMVNYPQQNGDYKLAAGWMIEKCGWKGRRCGTVGVYEKQALVLVNLGGATGADVRRVAQEIQADVWSTFAVELEVEPVFT